MLVKITGVITHRGAGFVLVEQGGLGYRVSIPEPAAYPMEQPVTFFLHEVVREEERVLFGFSTMDALELFWKLTTVSGVGPKIGQKLLGAGSVPQIRERIMNGDVTFLCSVPGVGKKIAQKIVLELKGSLVESDGVPVGSVHGDVLSALVSLGYPRSEAEDAVRALPPDLADAETGIRLALKRV